MSNVVNIQRAPKSERTVMDTIIVNNDVVETWLKPPCQRPLHINAKCREVAQEIKENGGVLPGVITLAIIDPGKKDAGTYLFDGQHRIECWRMSEHTEGYADVRYIHFDNLAEMGVAYVRHQKSIVAMKPDDDLRALEKTLTTLQIIRRECPFVGYGNIRRNATASSVLSMSVVLRCWTGSVGDTPTHNGIGAHVIASDLTDESARQLCTFLNVAFEAWGRDLQYARMWSALNLSMCMWLWRQLVLSTDRKLKRSVVLTPSEFKKCLMGLTADDDYMDWLQGRKLGERDRSPCYSRIKNIFVHRFNEMVHGGRKIKMPAPAWASSSGRGT